MEDPKIKVAVGYNSIIVGTSSKSVSSARTLCKGRTKREDEIVYGAGTFLEFKHCRILVVIHKDAYPAFNNLVNAAHAEQSLPTHGAAYQTEQAIKLTNHERDQAFGKILTMLAPDQAVALLRQAQETEYVRGWHDKQDQVKRLLGKIENSTPSIHD